MVGKIALEGAAVAEKQLTNLETYTKNNEKALKTLGVAFTAVGAVITGVMALSLKSAIAEQVNIKRLEVALAGVGVAYDDVKESLEGVITATQRKTGIADSEQRDTLNRLILVTKDYNKALELLPTALDLATIGQLDASTAATYLGQAYLQLEAGAESVGVRLGQATVEFKDMAAIQKAVGGAAEEAADPIKILTAEIGDMAETIGVSLIPVVRDLISKRIVPVIGFFKDWLEANEDTAKTLIYVTGAVGLLSLAIGILALALPKLPGMILAVRAALNLLLGPVGWVTFAIGALVTAGVIFSQEWGRITNRAENDTKRMTDTVIADLQKQEKAELDLLATKKKAAQDSYDAAINLIESEYSRLETLARSKEELAEDSSDAVQETLRRELDRSREVHDEKISMLQTEYDQKIKTLNAEADAQISTIQSQIDAINNQTDLEARALKQRRDQDDLARLQKNYKEIQSGQDGARLLKDITDKQAQIARDALLQERDDEKDSLRAQIDGIRSNARTQADILAEELKEKVTTEDAKLAKVVENTTKLQTYLDGWLTVDLYRIKTEGEAKIQAEKDKLAAAIKAIEDLEKALTESYKRQEAAAADHAKQMMIALSGGTSTGLGGSTIERPVPVAPSDWFKAPQSTGGITAGVTVTGNTFNVRNDNDIDKIAEAIVGKLSLKGVRP